MYILCAGLALSGLMLICMIVSQYLRVYFFFWFSFCGLMFSAALIFLGLKIINGGFWLL